MIILAGLMKFATRPESAPDPQNGAEETYAAPRPKFIKMASFWLTYPMKNALETQIETLSARGLAAEKIAESLGMELCVVESVLGISADRPEELDDEQLALSVLRDIAKNRKVNPHARLAAATTLLDEKKGRRGAMMAATTAIGAAALDDALKALGGERRTKAFSVFDKKPETKEIQV